MKLRARITQPEFYSSGDLLRLPREIREFYRSIWAACEDSGCVENDPFELKVSLYPSPLDSDVTPEVISGWIGRLVEIGKLLPYQVDGKEYLWSKNFHRHQQLRNSSSPNIPLPTWLKFEAFPSNPRQGNYFLEEKKLVSNSCLQSAYNKQNVSEDEKKSLTNFQEPKNGVESDVSNSCLQSAYNKQKPLTKCFQYNTNQYNINQSNLKENIKEKSIPKNPQPAASGAEDYSPDFREFWKIYPKKLGIQKAFRCWKARLKEGRSGTELRLAAENYAQSRRTEDQKFTLYAATFLGPDKHFLDWITAPEKIHSPRDVDKFDQAGTYVNGKIIPFNEEVSNEPAEEPIF